MCNLSRKYQTIAKDEEMQQVLKRNNASSEATVDTKKKNNNNTNISNNGKIWLCIWMFNNIGLTLLNKAAFANVDFKYPYYLSFIHMACNAIGAEIILSMKRSRSNKGLIGPILSNIIPLSNSKELDRRGYIFIIAFSIIFSLNIALGNVSLRYVSVNFNQVMRSAVPAITIALGILLGKKFTLKRMCSIIPIIAGVCMVSYGDMSYTVIGFNYTLAAIILAALKVVMSNEVLTGALKLHPIELLQYMAPLAMIQCLILSFVMGETTSIASRWDDFNPFLNAYPLAVIITSGITSFSLNICSLTANKLTSPLTMCIAANVKQVLMIVISTIVFETRVEVLNGCGIVFVLVGGAFYSYICFVENNDEKIVIETNVKKVVESQV